MILVFLLSALLIFAIYIAIKNQNTFENHSKVIRAISIYNTEVIRSGVQNWEKTISVNCIENYEKTLFRLHDWSYKKIVPPDVLEKIEPYIKKRGTKNDKR